MATQPNIEYEAAKFLQKLIQESRDEPAKLATKLYVILQHMKASGKEHSMPFQVISRAMETVVHQHGLDIESLKPSRTPTSGGSQTGECPNSQSAGCPQVNPTPQESQLSMLENDLRRNDQFSSGRPPSVPNSVAFDAFPGSAPHRSATSCEHESPSSMDTRSGNSNEQMLNQKDAKRSCSKRKRPDSLGSESHLESSQQFDMQGERLFNNVEAPGPLPGVGSSGKVQEAASALGPYSGTGGYLGASSLDSSPDKATVDHEYWKQGFMRGTVSSLPERQVHGLSPIKAEIPVVSQSTSSETSRRSAASREAGKLPMGPALLSSMPFKDYHLKQLRAQCLVFLAFRNGLMPKRLHLEVALGENIPKGGIGDSSQREFVENKENEPVSIPEAASLQANLSTVRTERVPPPALVEGSEVVIAGKEADNVRLMREKSGASMDASVVSEEQKQLLPAKHMESGMHGVEMSGTSGSLLVQPWRDSSNVRTSNDQETENNNMRGDILNQVVPVIGLSKQSRPEMTRHAGIGSTRELSGGPSHTSEVQQDLTPKIIDSSANQPEGIDLLQGLKQFDNNSLHRKPAQGVNIEHPSLVALNDANVSPKHVSHEPEEADKLVYVGLPPPKYTTTDKWIMIQQKKRRVNEDNWTLKHQKVDQRIAERFSKLKETVSSSDDISAKTRSVIELKKLQLLQLQRRLRSNIMNDFFKSITTEVDRLKSIKKHRIGRRLKHVEKYELRMKEERQKRVRERQKDFFSEVELHKERLDDVFKYKKERWRGFNRYVKEFHKRKERLHREKIDRIQREKINLLKINDVEGYLRMVQDAKSDRVKQLLKETEKYLQKLGAKLQEAKSLSRQFENEMDESQTTVGIECNEYFGETEDENDQAKHYKESNEKYYMIAHSIKEIITEQPAGLQGGILREYQMNGLRWLVSLYNNHLNGILADEMGLGKTVQVISLICYLMETKNDRGPFLVVVPSSVLPGWDSEINSWAPGVNKIVYAGPPEERRRLFKECIVHQKFNVLLTTYEYLMNKHDRPKLSKIHWHYVIIDEGHRIKNASCKLNADLKLYQSSHRLLLTGTPLQNSLEELWALLNFLLPNIFNSSEDFSQWFNKPFESNGDNSPDEALLSEEENLLIINRLHQVLRPFVLRRLKHKVENELPEKIERLVRCEASAYQKLLMKRVEENLGSLVNTKARSIHNSVMELRNICNHPYLSQLHVEEVDTLIPKHFLPPIVRLCGKLEMLDRLLPKLKATGHRILFFSTMTRLLDVMEDYLIWKQYRYLRLDGHTSGNDRGALIDQFNHPDSPYFIFLLSIRAGGVGVNLQAADTVIIFDTDWNPQVDLQAQARAHRIGQKKDVLVLRLETVNTVEEQVRASAEHKLGVANQSITAGFFDNNTSAEDRREYLESLLRESKKEEAAPVLEDDSLNDLLARSESEIDVFESIDQKRREEEMATWKRLANELGMNDTDGMPPLPNRLVLDDDLKEFYEAMKVYEVAAADSTSASNIGMKRKGGTTGSYDTQHYGRGKRAREVRSYEEQWTEEEFEKICQTEFLETHKSKEQQMLDRLHMENSIAGGITETPSPSPHLQPLLQTSLDAPVLYKIEVSPPVKRSRGRPRRIPLSVSPTSVTPVGAGILDPSFQKETVTSLPLTSTPITSGETVPQNDGAMAPKLDTTSPASSVEPLGEFPTAHVPSVSLRRGRGSGRRGRGRGEAGTGRGRGRKPGRSSSSGSAMQKSILEQSVKPSGPDIDIAPTGLASDVREVNPMPVPHNQTIVGATCSFATNIINTGATGVYIEPNISLTGRRDPTPQTGILSSKDISIERPAQMSHSEAPPSANFEASTSSSTTPGSCDLSICDSALPPPTGSVHSAIVATSAASPTTAEFSPTRSEAENETSRCRKVITIVLALKTSSFGGDLPDSDYTNVIGEERCSEIQQDKSSPPEEIVPQPKTNVGSKTSAADQLDEEILPPPGFETKLSITSQQKPGDPGKILEEDSVPVGFSVSNVSPSKLEVIRSAQIDHAETPVCSSSVQDMVHNFPLQLSSSSEKNEDSGNIIKKKLVPSGFGIAQTLVQGDKGGKTVHDHVAVICHENEALLRSNLVEPERDNLLSDKSVGSDASPFMDKNRKVSAEGSASIAQDEKYLVLQEVSVSDTVIGADDREPSISPAPGHTTFEHEGGKIQEMNDMQKGVPPLATVVDRSVHKGRYIGLEPLACEQENTQKASKVMESGINASSSDVIGAISGEGAICEDNTQHVYNVRDSPIEGGCINEASLAQNVAGTADLSLETSCNVVDTQVTGSMSIKDDEMVEQHTSDGCISSNTPTASKNCEKCHGGADADSEILEDIDDQSKDGAKDDTSVKETMNDVSRSSLGPELHSTPVLSNESSKCGEEQNATKQVKGADLEVLPDDRMETSRGEIAEQKAEVDEQSELKGNRSDGEKADDAGFPNDEKDPLEAPED